VESMILEVARGPSVRGGDAFEVLGDAGTGTIDTDVALTDRPIDYWEGIPHQRGHLLDGHTAGLHLDAVLPDGHAGGRHLAGEHLRPSGLLLFETLPLYFGRFQFAARQVDRAGNRSAELSSVASSVVNASPRPAGELACSGFDETERRASFSFVPSPEL